MSQHLGVPGWLLFQRSPLTLCVDFQPLNDSVLREVHLLPKVEETLAQLSGATVFSKIDANCGFLADSVNRAFPSIYNVHHPIWQVLLQQTPLWNLQWIRTFSKQMNNIRSGLPGVLCHMDDVLIFGSTHKEHNDRLHKVLQKL